MDSRKPSRTSSECRLCRWGPPAKSIRGVSSAQIQNRPNWFTTRVSAPTIFTPCAVGVACLPALLVAEDLSGGALVRLLPSLSSQSGVVHAVFPSRRGMVPAVRSLLDSLSAGFTANPWLVSDD
jgi:DNA-binding transcriptional LysR family regulator